MTTLYLRPFGPNSSWDVSYAKKELVFGPTEIHCFKEVEVPVTKEMALGLKNWDRHCCEGLGGGTRRWLSSETSNCPLGVTGTLWPLISAVDWWSTMASSSLAASFVGLLSFCPNDGCSCILFCSLLASTATRHRHLLSNICFACFQPAPKLHIA